MESATITLRDGDIYRWHYREPSKNDGAWGRYHCCSCIAIVERGRLYDTFWSSGGSDRRSFGEDDLPKLKLEYLGNLADLDRTSEWKRDYYDDADIIDLNHSNSTNGNFYIRKGAKRSAQKMLQVAREKLERIAAEQRIAAIRADDLRAAIVRIEGGETDLHL